MMAGTPHPAHCSSEGVAETALVLAGGLGLGAFEAGAYAAFDAARVDASLAWVAGSSIGAVTAAIIGGNTRQERVKQLHRFWDMVAFDPAPLTSFWFGAPQRGIWRQSYNQASTLQTLAFGRPGLFRPRLLPGPQAGVGDVPAVFDLQPLAATLKSLVDFDQLNSGMMRVTIAATDVSSGERVIFDTGQGDVIRPEHILASCALMPVFAPIEVEGRLLADGAFSSNAPLDVVLADPASRGMRCFVVDLFGREGSRPHTLAASASRAGDMAFSNQTRRLMDGQERTARLRSLIAQLGSLMPADLRNQPEFAAILAEGSAEPAEIVSVSYSAGLDEAGFAKSFDFSAATIADRWRAGEQRMESALAVLAPRMTSDANPV